MYGLLGRTISGRVVFVLSIHFCLNYLFELFDAACSDCLLDCLLEIFTSTVSSNGLFYLQFAIRGLSCTFQRY